LTLRDVRLNIRVADRSEFAPADGSHVMSSRNLPSLAHALSVAPDYDAALVALGEGLADVDRTAHLGLLRYDARREMLRERLTPNGGRVVKTPVETTFDHLPATIRTQVAAGGQFVDLGDRSPDYARMFGFPVFTDGGILSLRGVLVDGCLAAVVALYEQKKMFGTRSIAFSSDGKLAASTSVDLSDYKRGKITLWDLKTRRKVVEVSDSDGLVYDASFSPAITRAPILASGIPVALATNGTVREARGLTSSK